MKTKIVSEITRIESVPMFSVGQVLLKIFKDSFFLQN